MRLTLIALLAAVAGPAIAVPAASPSYAVTARIAGPDGSWDYAKVDPETHRLFIARSGSVTVIDLAGGGISSWGEIARGHAVVPLPGNRLLVTSGNDGTVRFLDTTTGRQIASVAVGKKADAAIFDAANARAFVMNADGGTVSVLDTATMRVSKTITVKPALEYAALVGGTLFINDEDANEIEVVDIASGKAGKPIAMPGCEGPTGLGYDERTGHLVSACANGKAVIADAKARRVVGMVDTGKGADAVILDTARRLAFVPCGKDGVLDILSLDAPGGVMRVGRVTTEVGARTGALDPATGAIYLPTAAFSVPATPGARPTAVPGSFHVLVVKPA
ncbi:YncE family protein [Sphingomonas immobilis]|uniref:Gluconolactonase n=1 Tax=Sphingomonas immobilis TaxID=3063997 RepID=A0ABT9A0W9_9SPHN|nr:gluconolactonase [Sphingomonas sp. CA1-15]MDO7842900.1 gluconolactonase [Sphingomonas sp. CA1-15]